jgi:hypothetical protein
MHAHSAIAARAAAALLCLAGMAAANLLANPDFSAWENANQPSGWIVESLPMVAVEQEGQTTFSPPYSAKLTRGLGGTGNNYGLKQYVPAQPGGTYTVAARCYDDHAAARGGISITWCRADSTSRGTSGNAYSDSAIHTWQRIAKTDTAPDSTVLAKVLVRCYSFTGQPAGGFVFFDNAEFDVGTGAVAEPVPGAARGPRLALNPNPVVDRIAVSLELAREADARLLVYDLAGSLRASLFSGRLPPGPRTLSVLAVGPDRKPLPDGLYFVVLNDAGGDLAVRKIAIRH